MLLIMHASRIMSLKRADHAATQTYRRDRDARHQLLESYAVQHQSITPSRAVDGLHTPCREVHRFTQISISPFLFSIDISLPNSLRTPNEPLNHLFQLTPYFIHALPLCLHISPILNSDRSARRLRKLV
jgi:hypothetical protein